MNTGFTYYEIWNTKNEYETDCSECCVSLEIAKKHLEHHCDWCRPAGTGRIYKVDLIPQEDGTLLRTMNMVVEVK